MGKYTLNIPDALYEEVARCASRHGESVVARIRKYLTMGLIAEKTPFYTKNDAGEFIKVLLG